jgi:hypothetical protein
LRRDCDFVADTKTGFVDPSSTAVAAFPLGGVVGLILVGAAWLAFELVRACRAGYRRRGE